MLQLLFCLCWVGSNQQVEIPHRTSSIEFMKSLQHESGAFSIQNIRKDPKAVPSIRATRTAVRTFNLLGSRVPNERKVLSFLKACYSAETGGFADRPGEGPDPISTSVSLMILKLLDQPTEPYLKKAVDFMARETKNFEEIRMVAPSLEDFGLQVQEAQKWGKIIDEAKNSNGSYGQGLGLGRTTALRIVARQRLRLSTDDKATILPFIQKAQRKDGGFGGEGSEESDLEACYRIGRLFSRLETLPDRPEELKKFIERCHHSTGGYGVKPGVAASLHGTYYATIVSHWLSGGK